MGQTLDLFVSDDSIESPYISRSFKDEVIIHPSYFSLEDFLSEDEIKIITPNSTGEITIGNKRPVKDSDISYIYLILLKQCFFCVLIFYFVFYFKVLLA